MERLLSSPELAAWVSDVTQITAIRPARPGPFPLASRMAGGLLATHALLNQAAAFAAPTGAMILPLTALAVDLTLSAALVRGYEPVRLVAIVRIALGCAMLVLSYVAAGDRIDATLQAFMAVALLSLLVGRPTPSRAFFGASLFGLVACVELVGVLTLLGGTPR